MRLLLLSVASVLCFSVASAQKFHLDLFGGAANYQGDLQTKRFTFSQARMAVGAGVSYELTDKIFLKTGLTFGKITADDKLNPSFKTRNLNFTSLITEGRLVGEYYFRNMNDYAFSPYIFGGVAIFHFNPFTFDTSGNKVFLKPLSTEGEGFLPGKKEYSLTQISIPFGAGVKLALSDDIHVGLEIGLRKTFTDYLDDISTDYVDQNLLFANRGQKAVELAYRGGELKNGSSYPGAGDTRGGPKYKDWYYFSGITTSFRLGTGARRSNSRSGVGCPARLY